MLGIYLNCNTIQNTSYAPLQLWSEELGLATSSLHIHCLHKCIVDMFILDTGFPDDMKATPISPVKEPILK